jgi:integrase
MARGSIEKRGKSWRIRVEVGRSATGSRTQRSRSGYKTRREAERALAEWLAELDRGIAVDGTRMTVAEYLHYWHTTVAVPTKEPNTADQYLRFIDHHICPTLGPIPLQRLTPQQVQSLYAAKGRGGRRDRKPGGLSATTINTIHRMFNSAMRQAVAWALIALNPLERVTPPRRRRSPARAWNVESVRRFLAEGERQGYHPLWLLAITTGMRRGELLGLRWQDIDLARGTAEVVQTIIPRRGHPIVHQPKTPTSHRTVLLMEEAIAALRAHRKLQLRLQDAAGPAWHDHNLVFTTPDGKPIYPAAVNMAFKRICARAGVEVLRFHDLRHTSATLDLVSGSNVKAVSERLGHASTKMTQDVHGHSVTGLQEQALRNLQALLFGPRAQSVPNRALEG